jgi:hypothetical protein
MSNWYSPRPMDVPDNAQKPETVIYGPRGEALIKREPRPIGFRQPIQPAGPVLQVPGGGGPITGDPK